MGKTRLGSLRNRIVNKPLFILYLVMVCSCTSMRLRQERYQYNFTRNTLKYSVPASVINDCGYQFDLPMPIVKPVDNLLLAGSYDKDRNLVLYKSGHYKALSHEFMHYLNQNGSKGSVSWDCINEVSAYLITRIQELKSENNRLRLGMNK